MHGSRGACLANHLNWRSFCFRSRSDRVSKMVTARSFTLLAGFVLTRLSTAAPKADILNYAGADSQKLDRRQTGLIPTPAITNGGMHTMPMPIPILTIITMPDHSGQPVTVTSQNQLVTSYVPVLTICPLGSSNHSTPFVSSASGIPTAASNASILPTAPIKPSNPIPIPPFLPISPPKIIIAEKRQLASYYASSCSTSYTPTVTPICATTLSPLAAPLILITACDQFVTFSSEFGYTLVPASRTGHDDGTMIRKRQEASSTAPCYIVYVSERPQLTMIRHDSDIDDILRRTMGRVERWCGSDFCVGGRVQ